VQESVGVNEYLINAKSGPNLEPRTVRVDAMNGSRDGLNIGRKVDVTGVNPCRNYLPFQVPAFLPESCGVSRHGPPADGPSPDAPWRAHRDHLFAWRHRQMA